MKVSKPLIILGIIIIVIGLIFHLQGQALVGPESSFMYSNPEWITYGQQIAISGILIIVVGMIFKIKSKW
jgi:hypothetical protein